MTNKCANGCRTPRFSLGSGELHSAVKICLRSMVSASVCVISSRNCVTDSSHILRRHATTKCFAIALRCRARCGSAANSLASMSFSLSSAAHI